MANKIKSKQRPDFVMLIIVLVMIIWGLITVAGVSFSISVINFNHPWHYFLGQVARIGFGLALGFIFYKISSEKIKKIAPALFFFNLALLVIVLLPSIGHSSGGAQRWFSLGIGGITVQPSELLKITFALYLAAWLSKRDKKASQKEKVVKVLAPFVAILVVVVATLILQPDMSTLAIICAAGLIMYLVSSTPLWHFVALVGGLVSLGLIFIKTSAYRLQRLFNFSNPTYDIQGSGFQLKQAEIALGSGRMFGFAGGFNFGLSRQKALIPHPMTDSIFAIIGEELGFFGACLVIGLFLLFLFWSLRIAGKCDDNFKKVAVVGIASWIVCQAFFNIAGITRALPLGGVPLPFFSYGGSHIVAELMAMGVLLNFSKS